MTRSCPSVLEDSTRSLKLIDARAYISTVRRLSPTVPGELEEYIANAYSNIRQEEAKSTTPHSYTTIRTLLSILRISVEQVLGYDEAEEE
ncbi:minichromosome maintenance (MCM2/3/5) family protein, putative [Medicago truncatula]|uniref:DNA helicase n=1 Tax=Medicago truncatula TaxID=3880 RepID=A0A072TW89_MEDTR|nr:minichromosome maintenance (MCM2/3/5) family protein, putative [Medicago truncatula]